MRDRLESTDILLIGGGVASVRAARTLRREGFEGEILIVGAEDAPPYNRPPLSKELLRDDLPDDLVAAEPPSWYERRRIGLRTGTEVVQLDLEARLATLTDRSTIGFEQCLIATGAEPIVPPIPGVEHARLLRTLPDSRALRAAALAASGGRVAIVGGGFIGVEVASALAALGLRPVIVEREGMLWGGTLGPELGGWAIERLGEAGVAVMLGSPVTAVTPEGLVTPHEAIRADLVIVAVGVRPRVELAASAGLAIDDGIVTDPSHRTSHPAAWAAGDVARVGGRRVEHWHAAREGGERAALGMLGRPVPPPAAPWLFSEVGGSSLDVFGMAGSWDEARWVRPGSVLAYLEFDAVVQLAVVGSALDATVARRLVERRAPMIELAAALDG